MRIRPVVIAHRGASGYLPEHTLVSKALAFGMGADFLEQDVVATRDGELIVFHDLTLEHTTDVRHRHPGRARADGSFYCIDFELDELRELNVVERRAPGETGRRYPGRFPDDGGRFGIPTLEEELAFIQGLMQSTGRQVGIYPEIKEPAWHRRHGVELGDRMLEILASFGYESRDDAAFVQCFDADELKRLRSARGCRLRLVQLIDSASGVPSPAHLAEVADYADAIGPSLSLIYRGNGVAGPMLTSLVGDAHAAGLAVHPYTLRKDDLPTGIGEFGEIVEVLLGRLGVDGVFTDFPDIVASYVATRFPAG